MKILMVDDDLVKPIESSLRNYSSIYLSNTNPTQNRSEEIEKIRHYFEFDIITEENVYKINFIKYIFFEQAFEGVQYINKCSLDELPDLAILDVDFKLNKDEKSFFRNIDFNKQSGSYPLGLEVYKEIKKKDKKKICDIIIYTGKNNTSDIIRGLTAANDGNIAVHDKVQSINDIIKILCDKTRTCGFDYIRNKGLPNGVILKLDHFLNNVIKYIDEEDIAGIKNIDKISVIADCAAIFNLFPHDTCDLLSFGMKTEEAVRFFKSITDFFDNNWTLCRMFKKISLHGGAADYYSTPLAAACHGFDWDYSSNEFINTPSKSYLFDVNKIDRINNWFSNEVYLCADTKKVIEDESKGNLIEWASNYGKNKTRWESLIGYYITPLINEFASSISIKYNDKTSCTYLTDWQYLFGGKNSVFGQFIQISINEQAKSVEITTTEINNNLTLVIRINTNSHCGDNKQCFCGNSLDPVLLKNWGRSWYRISSIDNTNNKKTKYVQYSIWPNVEMESITIDGDHDPSIELFFEMKNYLKMRCLSS